MTSDVLYMSGGMREKIEAKYGNLTMFVALQHGRELKKVVRVHDDMYELLMGPEVSLFERRQMRGLVVG